MIKPPTTVELQLTLRSSDHPDFVRLVKHWFVGALHHLCGDIYDDTCLDWTQAEDVLDLNRLFMPTSPASVELYIGRQENTKAGKQMPWTPPSLREFLSQVAQPGTTGVVVLHQTSSRGYPELANIEIILNDIDPSWVYLVVSFDQSAFQEADVARRMLGFLRGFADKWNPSFGHIAPQLSIFRTALESLLRKNPDEMVIKSRKFLRGYSWVTVCPQEVGDRLGGLTALATNGAFDEVRALAAGGYWLRATPTFAEFDDAAAERVFRVLAPGLPAGMPMDPSGWTDKDRYKIVLEDAAICRAQ